MRRCKFDRFVKDEYDKLIVDEKGIVKLEIVEGYFHQLVSEAGNGNVRTIGIVELDNGEMKKIPVEVITFIDKIETKGE